MRKSIDHILETTLVILMGVMTLDVLWGVFTRYVMGAQASWSEELARFLLIWIGILGAAYAAGKKMHLAIDLYPTSLPVHKQKRLYIFIHSLVILFCLSVLIVGGIRLVYVTSTLGQVSAALGLPLAVVYTIVPISGLLVIYYKALDIISLQKSQG